MDSEELIQSQMIDLWTKQIREADISSQSKLVALMLASRIGQDSLSCNVDYERLKTDCGVSSNTVYLALKQLIYNGFITKQRQMGDSNTYSIVVKDVQPIEYDKLKQSQIIAQWKKQVRQADISIYAKGLALIIDCRLDQNNLSCSASYTALMKDARVTRSTLIKYINELVENGYLFKQRRKNMSNIYSIVPFEDEKIVH